VAGEILEQAPAGTSGEHPQTGRSHA
jgi:hypothetical protein